MTAESSRVLTSVLFTDIAGSTQQAAERGDDPMAQPACRACRHVGSGWSPPT